eukprot:756007-Hanusia_phi.AAC.4
MATWEERVNEDLSSAEESIRAYAKMAPFIGEDARQSLSNDIEYYLMLARVELINMEFLKQSRRELHTRYHLLNQECKRTKQIVRQIYLDVE